MPVTPPPTYVTHLPDRAAAHDSILITHQRRQRGGEPPAARPEPAIAPLPQVPPAAPLAAALPAPIEVLPRRAPVFEPTRMVHQGLPAVNERQEQSDLVRVLRRITLTETKYTPEQKADQVVDWMVANGFMARQSASGRASQRPSKFYGHDVAKSKLFTGHGVAIQTNMPWLKDEQVAAIRALLIDRVHAFKADPRSFSLSTRDALVRYFKLVKDKVPLLPVAVVQTTGAVEKLTRLRALHMDDVYFDHNKPLSSGAQGQFFAGITSKFYPVAIKQIKKDGAKEAQLMRRLTVGGYLQAHYTTPPLVVMPCYSGTFNDFSKRFYEVPSTPRQGASGGLIGTRYMMSKLLIELDYLHNEMHGLHFDIKGTNIFVSKTQKLLVLGDFGISAVQSDCGDASFTGRTVGFCSPEQLDNSNRLTQASDIFSLAATICNGLIYYDPAFRRLWRSMFPDVTRPKILFPADDKKAPLYFSAWTNINSGLPQQPSPFADITFDEEAAEIAGYERQFRRIDSVMQALDAPLWTELRAALRTAQSTRPSAMALRGTITLNEQDKATCERVWDTVEPFNKSIGDEVARLKRILRRPAD